MRVLMVHNHYQIRGGEDECNDAEQELLRAGGIEVDSYEDDNHRVDQIGRLRVGMDTIWSSSSYDAIRARLRAGRHDVVHVHNFFPLISPAVYYAAKAEGAAVVQTLHNYRLSCPSGIYFRDGKVCVDCKGRLVAWPGVARGCYRGSRLGTATVAAMLTAHRLLGTWRDRVDLYIALNDFMRRQAIASGLPASKVVIKPNFVGSDPGPGDHRGGFALFVGRLNPEKGVRELLAAWQHLGRTLPLYVMGDGPLTSEVQQAASANPSIHYLGRRPLQEFYELLGQARMFMFPSTWYEGFPRVISEAYARGTPIIASAIGPIAEVVIDGVTGLHFRPGDVGDMVQKVEGLLAQPELETALQQGARREYEREYTAATNLDLLLRIYERAIKQAGGERVAPIETPVPAM
jgi:glycosyltransferase involved in cell wall biosynthesis